jgi:hypothetical protein
MGLATKRRETTERQRPMKDEVARPRKMKEAPRKRYEIYPENSLKRSESK